MALHNIDGELTKLRIDKGKKRPARRGFGTMLFILVLLAGLGGGGFAYYTKVNAAIPVKVVRAERAEVEAGAQAGTAVLTAGGYVIPRNRIEISSKIIGRVKDILVERGDKVKEGDVLLRIEDDEYQAQVHMSESRLLSAKAHLAELKAGSRPQEIRAANADVLAAEVRLQKAKADIDRLKKLAEDKIISAQEYDQWKNTYDVAKATLDAAKERTKLVEIGPRKEEIDSAAAQVKEAEANLAYAKTQLGFTVMTAPVTGTILEKIAEKGELVTNSNFGGTRGPQSAVVEMANLSDLQVELDLNENDLPKVKLHQKTEIRLDSNPDMVFKGEVDELAPQADRQKATVQVKVRLLDPNEYVRPEVNARVTFLEDEKPKEKVEAAAANEPIIRIPTQAVVRGADGTKVFIALEGKAFEKVIKIKREGPKGVEVSEGLIGTESLIVEPLDKITNGVKIQVTS